MDEPKPIPQHFEKDAESGEMWFAGTRVPVRNLFLAVEAEESIQAFCDRTGVPREVVAKTLALAATAVPQAAEHNEVWRVRLAEMQERAEQFLKGDMTKKWWWKWNERAMSIVLPCLTVLMIFLLIATGWRLANRAIYGPPKPAVAPMPR